MLCLGLLVCKLCGCVSILSVSVSVFTLVAISVDRYEYVIVFFVA